LTECVAVIDFSRLKIWNAIFFYLLIFLLVVPTSGSAEQINAGKEILAAPNNNDFLWLLILGLVIALVAVLIWNRKLSREVTAHSQIEKALIESQFLLEEAQQMAHVGNWELDPKTMKATWSDEVFNIFGMQLREDVGPECLETILHPADKEAVMASLLCATKEVHRHHMEYRIIKPEGEICWVNCSAEQIWDEGGKLLKLRGVIQDITLRKTNELQLQEREQQVRDLLDSTAEAIYGLDTQGLCIFANPACASMLGYQNAEQLIGQNMHELIHHSKADGSPYQEENCPVFQAFLSGTSSHVENEVFWRADGSCLRVEYWSYPMLREEKVTGAVVTFMDISERLQAKEAVHDSEERYRTIFEGAPEGVWLIGPDRCTIEVNKRFCDLLGYSKAEMVGKKPIDFVDEENKKIFIAQTSQIESTNRREYEIALRHKDGHNIPTYFSANTLHTSMGEVLEAVAFVTDLSEQKIAEKALRRAQKMDALGQLTGGIAHDFNNILSIILGNLTLLKSSLNQDEKSYRRVKTVEKSARRAADLTKQLLGFSRRQAAKVSVTDINRVIGDMNNLIARSLTPEVNLQQKFADNLWLTQIDPGDFEDALLNLVFNARDAMPNGGNLIIESHNATLDEVYCSQNLGAVAGEYVQVVVSDSGNGISSAQQEHIFEPFYTTKAQGKGTGLGLPMVYGFVKRSKGYIKVYSELGIGTTFRVYLPRSHGQDRPHDSGAEQEQVLPRGNETVLIVDDEEDLLELTRDSLQALGYRVLSANNAHQALRHLSHQPSIQLLFSDVVMPGGLNGFELAEKAAELYPELKILLTSGFVGEALAQNRSASFKDEMLNKPYTQVDLAIRLREIFGQTNSQTSQNDTNSKPEVNLVNIPVNMGIAEIDEDHKKIFELLNKCREIDKHAVSHTESQAEIKTILDDLKLFTETHFPREEKVLEVCDYPGLENHRQVHKMLSRQLEKLHSSFNKNTLTGDMLLIFLNDWVNDHIQSMDSLFVSYCEGKTEKITKALRQLELTQKGNMEL